MKIIIDKWDAYIIFESRNETIINTNKTTFKLSPNDTIIKTNVITCSKRKEKHQ